MASNRERQQNVPPFPAGDQQMSPNFFEQNGISPHSQLYCRTGKLPFPVSTGHHSTPLYDRSNNYSQSQTPKYPIAQQLSQQTQQTHQFQQGSAVVSRANGNQAESKQSSFNPPSNQMACRTQQMYDSNNNGSPCVNCTGMGMGSSGMGNQHWGGYYQNGGSWNSQIPPSSSSMAPSHHHQSQQQQQQMMQQSPNRQQMMGQYMGDQAYSSQHQQPQQQQQLMYDPGSGMQNCYQSHYPQHQQFLPHAQQPQSPGQQPMQSQCGGMYCNSSPGVPGGMYQTRNNNRLMPSQGSFNRPSASQQPYTMRKSW